MGWIVQIGETEGRLSIGEQSLPPDHPHVGMTLNNLALLNFHQSKWQMAVADLRHGTAVLLKRTRRSGQIVGRALTAPLTSYASRRGIVFKLFAKAAFRLADSLPLQREVLSNEIFEMVQWGRSSESAAALSQMAARQAKGSSRLAAFAKSLNTNPQQLGLALSYARSLRGS